MKLQVRFLRAGAHSYPCYVLTDEQGHMLPGQAKVDVSASFDRAPTVTATFLVDDKNIILTSEEVVVRDGDRASR